MSGNCQWASFYMNAWKHWWREHSLEMWGEFSTVVHLEFWWYYKQDMCLQGLHACSWHHECCNCELQCSWWNNLAQVGHQEINYGGIDTWKYQLEENVGPEFKCIQGLEKGICMFMPHGVCARSYNSFL